MERKKCPFSSTQGNYCMTQSCQLYFPEKDDCSIHYIALKLSGIPDNPRNETQREMK